MNAPENGRLVRPASAVWAVVLSTVVLGLTLAPVVNNWRKPPVDDFPLSYYPMFSQDRGTETELQYLVGYEADGTRRVIPCSYAGSGGMNQARKQIRSHVKSGRADELATKVAGKLARKRDGDLAAVTRVEVVTGLFWHREYFAGRKDPVSETVHATAAVTRGAP